MWQASTAISWPIKLFMPANSLTPLTKLYYAWKRGEHMAFALIWSCTLSLIWSSTVSFNLVPQEMCLFCVWCGATQTTSYIKTFYSFFIAICVTEVSQKYEVSLWSYLFIKQYFLYACGSNLKPFLFWTLRRTRCEWHLN